MTKLEQARNQLAAIGKKQWWLQDGELWHKGMKEKEYDALCDALPKLLPEYAALLDVVEAAKEQIRHPHNPRSLEALSNCVAKWEELA